MRPHCKHCGGELVFVLSSILGCKGGEPHTTLASSARAHTLCVGGFPRGSKEWGGKG